MPDSNEFPQKCLECAKLKVSKAHSNCDICHELEFPEAMLCDLNRCVQDKAGFQCQAFRQALSLVGVPEYERALALQKLNLDPDSVILQLKYHFVWNVSHRMPVLATANDFIVFVHDTFLGCSEAVQGFVHLLYLAPDHVHLYVESDGERSVEDMVRDIKRLSAKAMLEEFAVAKDKLGEDMNLWDEAYFVETVG